jgi:hypothetical protein
MLGRRRSSRTASEVMNADLILVLDQGIVQRGTHEELMVEGGIYRQIYDLQVRIEAELEKELGAAQTSEAWETSEVYEETLHVGL